MDYGGGKEGRSPSVINNFKASSRNLVNRFVNRSHGMYESVQQLIAGRRNGHIVGEEEDVEISTFTPGTGRKMSVTSVRSILNNKRQESVETPTKEDEGDNREYSEYQSTRNCIVSPSTLFRKGPIPIESLPHHEQVRLSRKAMLKEWDDQDLKSMPRAAEEFLDDPTSKSLLTYFAR